MSTAEEREAWRARALWLSQLGLADGEPAPVEAVEEVANAVLVLLDELGSGMGSMPRGIESWEHDELLNLIRVLVLECTDMRRQRNEARAWARGFEHGMFEGVDTDNPPGWLTAPLNP